MTELRAGIDLGGTKIEIIVLDGGLQIYRQRVATPAPSYDDILDAIQSLHEQARQALAVSELPLGIGMPGALTKSGHVKNSNTQCLNGLAFQRDIEALMQQPVKVMNDANLFALSEAVDGAARDAAIVFGLILGTGVGGGLIVNRRVIIGPNSIAGEWGHNPLSPLAPRACQDSRPCYCGLSDCVETFLSGAGLLKTYTELAGQAVRALDDIVSVESIVQQSQAGDELAIKALQLYVQQLACALAAVINILDPDAIVLGGGLSNIPALVQRVKAELQPYVFSDTVNTLLINNCHGDSSGVRGAAWL